MTMEGLKTLKKGCTQLRISTKCSKCHCTNRNGNPSWIGETYYLEWDDQWIPDEPLDLMLLSPAEKRMLDSFRLFYSL